MPNSLLGLVFIIIFLAPGFIAIIETRQKAPLLAVRQSQVEFVLWGCVISLVCHVIVIAVVSLIAAIAAAVSPEISVKSAVLSAKLADLLPTEAKNIEAWHLFTLFGYILLVFIAAKLAGSYLTPILFGRKLGIMEYRSAWVDVFHPDRINYVNALLNNGYRVIGEAEFIQNDPDSLISGDRDLVIVLPTVINPEGQQEDSPAYRIIVNTRNISILEIAPGDTEKGDS